MSNDEAAIARLGRNRRRQTDLSPRAESARNRNMSPCFSCQRSRVKCEGGCPCRRCLERRTECVPRKRAAEMQFVQESGYHFQSQSQTSSPSTSPSAPLTREEPNLDLHDPGEFQRNESSFSRLLSELSQPLYSLSTDRYVYDMQDRTPPVSSFLSSPYDCSFGTSPDLLFGWRYSPTYDISGQQTVYQEEHLPSNLHHGDVRLPPILDGLDSPCNVYSATTPSIPVSDDDVINVSTASTAASSPNALPPERKRPKACEQCRKLRYKCEMSTRGPWEVCERCFQKGLPCSGTTDTPQRLKKLKEKTAKSQNTSLQSTPDVESPPFFKGIIGRVYK